MEASVTFLLENLKNIVLYHITLTSTVKHELNLLEIELDRMKIFLKTSNRRINDPVFQHWEKEIREVICEVEDTIDTYVVSNAAQNRSITSRFLKKLRPSLLSIEEQVKVLRESKVIPVFNQAKTELANLPVADASQTCPDESRDKRRKDPRQDNVVGFEDETDTLISYLKEDSDKLEVDSIIGMPGLGKTTVAWKIYQDPRIKFEFPTLIWVYVSQEFNKKDVLLTILKKFVRKDMSNCSVPELARRVKKHLERGKFLIFMDDVWSNEVWKDIKDFLPMSNRMGKVLITSRNESVALYANTGRGPHKLRFLTHEESWELLQLEVKLETMNKSLEKIGRHIATQCEGLPLSIIVIGGILVDRCSISGGVSALEKEWKRVCESVNTNLINDDKNKLVENIISLSYTSLPYGLRDCFLYLGMFPEDPEIPAWKLTHLWIAEGFIQKRPGRSVEEVAQDNLKDLITRNLVMVGKSKPDGEVKTCRVHDTIREFCKNEAKYENKNLFQEIKMSNEGVFEPPPENLEKFRRICIHSYVHDFLVKKPKVPNARAFLCFSKEPIVMGNADIASITDAFSLLRVFDANTLKFPKYPAKITQLIHLRYLTLSANDFHVLPDAITNLWNLQTLIVDTSSRTLEIRANIWQMMHLRHLKTKASVILIKDGGNGNGGEKLQTLGKLSPQSCTVDVFKKAKNLTTLAIRGDLLLLLESECLESLIRLNKLKLVNDAFPKVASENPLRGLPQPNRFPPMLKTLILSGTFLDWHHMYIIAQLHMLEALKLKDNAFMGNSWDVFVGGFHNLEFFYIERTNLMYWEAKADAFPKLRSLVLKNCEKLQVVPYELKETLEMLSMERVTPYAVTSARKIEQAKQQQIPEQQRVQRGVFKLLIAPGDQLPNY